MTHRLQPHQSTTVRLVRWFRTVDGWQSEIVRGRLLEHHDGVWRLVSFEDGEEREYPDAAWSLCHE
ncbi:MULTISPECIES: hypothetical protein [unclassified Rathayibacter]|jgi:hypothetical protein|uniref:hypothetical protein n=1 Tax=unclassified Rathayibacter TaxID=2609250 RepID=UPI000F4D190C|nr:MULTISPECIES: hypothetical protein [unclassified Rathayibacter]MCJ1705584.1 hypothetical protein [Rathayibacter sp. VKM Ac-2926]NRG40204.1 hypothetical protein [Rathayibacter sp. VKM Ac-2835]ROP57345.1 hypothetical protein EDF45_0875 [Rathayibacter sp. PhB186]ROQ16022.1 hypothetical protein EDF54_0894 [Rathayibacter sp. PhB93]ROS55730.1 hypothetical protein EDF44_0875 [Rathayibacter sp. PhB185]